MDHWKRSLFSAALTVLAASTSAQGQALAADPVASAALHVAKDAGASGREGGWLARQAVRASGAWRPLTGRERLNVYVRQAFVGPGAFFRAAGPALGSHLKNEPPEWRQGMEGYSRRFANRFGRFALKETYEAAGAAALGHEVRYLRSTRTGFLPRAAHALAATFITYDRNGQRTFHATRAGAAFAAEFTGNLWMPAGSRTRAQAVRGVGLELGMNSVFNLLREFSPELKRLVPWK
jgi:hypothetical protein